MRWWTSNVLKLRATVADLQLRQRPERPGRAATKEQRGSVRASLRGVERAGICGTVVSACECVGIRVQHARG